MSKDLIPIANLISKGWGDVAKRGPNFNIKDATKPQTPEERAYWARVLNTQDAMPTVADPRAAFRIISGRANKLLMVRGKKFLYDDKVDLIKNLCHYFTGNQCDYDLNKSIFLMGAPGRGKTFLLSLFTANWGDGHFFENTYNWVLPTKMCIKIVKSPEEAEAYYKCGSMGNILNTQNLLIDELGGEIALSPSEIGLRGLTFEELNNVGTMSDILQNRHALYVKHRVLTHLTSNITEGQKLAHIYSDRIVSRVNEMCNIITLQGEDLRDL